MFFGGSVWPCSHIGLGLSDEWRALDQIGQAIRLIATPPASRMHPQAILQTHWFDKKSRLWLSGWRLSCDHSARGNFLVGGGLVPLHTHPAPLERLAHKDRLPANGVGDQQTPLLFWRLGAWPGSLWKADHLLLGWPSHGTGLKRSTLARRPSCECLLPWPRSRAAIKTSCHQLPVAMTRRPPSAPFALLELTLRQVLRLFSVLDWPPLMRRSWPQRQGAGNKSWRTQPDFQDQPTLPAVAELCQCLPSDSRTAS